MFVLKHCYAPDLSDRLLCKTQSFETVAEKYSSSDVIIMFVHWQEIFRVATLKTHSITDCSLMQQLKDVAIKRLRTRLMFSQWWHQSASHNSQVVDSTPVWYLSITMSTLVRPTVVKWCRYNSSCPPYVRCQLKLVFFIFQQYIFARCWSILKTHSEQIQQ